MNQVSHDNRRIHSRRSARIAARLAHADGTVDGVIENIGAGGAFFATQDLELKADDGGAVTIAFRARRHGSEVDVECAGTVLRADLNFDGESVVRSFAIQFSEVLALDGFEFA